MILYYTPMTGSPQGLRRSRAKLQKYLFTLPSAKPDMERASAFEIHSLEAK
jgi:hypothetical protein